MVVTPLTSLVGHLRRITTDAARLTDRELLDAFQTRRDEAAFESLVRRHGPMVHGVCRRILADSPEVDDAFQATFLVLVKKAAVIDRPELLGNWLYGVACRTAHKARVLRARRHVRERPLTAMHQPASADRDIDPDLRAVLDEELARLPEKYRIALVLCELQGQSRKQAAQALGLPEGTLSSRLARGRQLLAQLLGRRGIVLSAGALAGALAQGRADAALSLSLIRSTLRAAMAVAAGKTAAAVSAPVALLTEGVIQAMAPTKLKMLLVFFAAIALLGAAVIPQPEAAQPAAQVQQPAAKPAKPAKGEPRGKSVIILWMSGGPSQMDTFDMKPGNANGGPFKEIDTAAKGIKISEHLPKLAKQMNDVALIRTLSHKEGDHGRGTHLMQTGYAPLDPIAYPAIGSVLARELGGDKSMVPTFVRLMPAPFFASPGAGFLNHRYAPLNVFDNKGALQPPDIDSFPEISKEQADAWRKVMAEAMDLSAEKMAVRDAYGKHRFGDSCLIARRLVEKRVPVIEITLGGWDTHQGNFDLVKKQSEVLDAAWSSLMHDLRERKLLDTTLIVWMGEFGRTPRINPGQGRDHWPTCFTVALAGGGIKGGQAIGATNADGAGIADRRVTLPEFHATIYAALGIDSTKQNQSNTGQPIRYVDGSAEPIAELLPKKAAPKSDKAANEARPKGVAAHLDRLARLPADLIKEKKTDVEIVDALFTSAVQRLPSAAERARMVAHLQAAQDREEGCRDLVWALVNTVEFFDLHSLKLSPQLANEFSDVLHKVWKK
jgi:RNA polymerase sigma factor (sigma-70 family)